MILKKLNIIIILVILLSGCTTYNKLESRANECSQTYTIDQLCDASLSNDIELVKKIIDSKVVDINQKDSEGYYPIEKTLPFENCELAIILLDAGANPHVISKYADSNNMTVYDYALNTNNKSFKDIFINHSKYKKGLN